jgi:hypothetical protein
MRVNGELAVDVGVDRTTVASHRRIGSRPAMVQNLGFVVVDLADGVAHVAERGAGPRMPDTGLHAGAHPAISGQ